MNASMNHASWYGFFCVRLVFSPRSSVTMKGGCAGAKVASASEDQGAPGGPPSPAEDTVGSAHTQGGGTGVTGAANRSAQRAVSRAESFPHKGEIRSLSRIHHAEPRASPRSAQGSARRAQFLVNPPPSPYTTSIRFKLCTMDRRRLAPWRASAALDRRRLAPWRASAAF
jgi:hypothetical protein